MMRTRIKEILQAKDSSQLVGKKTHVSGWVRTVRDQKSFAFIEINDGSTLANLQVIADGTIPGYAEAIQKLATGASASFVGHLVESPGKNQALELRAEEIR